MRAPRNVKVLKELLFEKLADIGLSASRVAAFARNLSGMVKRSSLTHQPTGV